MSAPKKLRDKTAAEIDAEAALFADEMLKEIRATAHRSPEGRLVITVPSLTTVNRVLRRLGVDPDTGDDLPAESSGGAPPADNSAASPPAREP